MEHTHQLMAIGWIGLSFGSCTGPPVTGGNYRLPEKDLREIRAVVSARPDIRQPILEIVADRPDHARVETGRNYRRGDTYNEFYVAKHWGHWQIASPIEQATIVITVD
jgi:hypothetical protein